MKDGEAGPGGGRQLPTLLRWSLTEGYTVVCKTQVDGSGGVEPSGMGSGGMGSGGMDPSGMGSGGMGSGDGVEPSGMGTVSLVQSGFKG